MPTLPVDRCTVAELVGLDEQPTEWRSDRRRELTNLGAGRYVFRVWGRDASGVVAGPAELHFTVRPAWWQTWWAWLGYLVAGSGIVMLAGRVRVARLKLRNRELSRLVEARTRLLAEANQTLASTNEELERALAEVETLTGILPICAWCRRIRDDAGYWQQVEEHVAKHTRAVISHGMCPECQKRELESLDPTVR